MLIVIISQCISILNYHTHFKYIQFYQLYLSKAGGSGKSQSTIEKPNNNKQLKLKKKKLGEWWHYWLSENFTENQIYLSETLQLPTIYISFSQNYNEYLYEEIHKWGVNNTFKLKGFSLHSAFSWINSQRQRALWTHKRGI